MNRERSGQLEAEYLEDHPGTAGTVEPFVYDDPADDEPMDISGIPLTTDLLLSDEWEETDEPWFVDSSGFGREGEPALTMEAFQQELREYVRENPEHGFGISSVGQFQLYVSAYRRV